MGWGGAEVPKDGVFIPTPHDFVLLHPHPLGPRKAPFHPVKLYFLLICPKTSTIFLMKPISLINILEITTKFIPSNQINF